MTEWDTYTVRIRRTQHVQDHGVGHDLTKLNWFIHREKWRVMWPSSTLMRENNTNSRPLSRAGDLHGDDLHGDVPWLFAKTIIMIYAPITGTKQTVCICVELFRPLSCLSDEYLWPYIIFISWAQAEEFGICSPTFNHTFLRFYQILLSLVWQLKWPWLILMCVWKQLPGGNLEGCCGITSIRYVDPTVRI